MEIGKLLLVKQVLEWVSKECEKEAMLYFSKKDRNFQYHGWKIAEHHFDALAYSMKYPESAKFILKQIDLQDKVKK